MPERKPSAGPSPSASSLIAPWLELLPMLRAGVPSTSAIWAAGREHLEHGERELARLHELLIFLLHNSVVPIAAGLNATSHFAYGGIGVVLHRDADFGEHVQIGQGVTVGGHPGKFRLGAGGRRLYVPRIGNHVFLGPGCRVVGGIEIGDFSVIGANAVVLADVPPFSVAAGMPARVVRTIDADNCLRYKGLFMAAREMSNEDFVDLIRARTGPPVVASRKAPAPAPIPPAPILGPAAEVKVLAPAPGVAGARPGSPYPARLAELARASLIATGRSIVDTGNWAAPTYDAYPLNPDIDWSADPFDSRTWSWHLHQFQFIPSLLAYDRATGDRKGAGLVLALLQSWSTQLAADRHHAAAWHDHGTALRARNVLLLRAHLIDRDGANAPVAEIDAFLRQHVTVLADPAFYSRFSNHGFDQSVVLLELAMELGGLSSIADLAVQRTEEEIRHAFSADGGHVENSCAYLNYGLKQALEAADIGHVYFGSAYVLGLAPDLLDRAVKALAFMVRPDGQLPMIGDTSPFVVRDFLGQADVPSYPQFQHAASCGTRGAPPEVLSQFLMTSGWAMFRGAFDNAASYKRSMHLVFKCGFLNTYHRHDDDLAFVLHALGEDWLVDAGLYKHAPTDPMRIYVRSADAHNISLPLGIRAHRQVAKVDGTWGLADPHDDGRLAGVTGRTGMFDGFDSRRQIRIDRSALSIRIDDSIDPVSPQAKALVNRRLATGTPAYATRFLFPSDKTLRVDAEAHYCDIVGVAGRMRIKWGSPVVDVRVHRGAQQPVTLGWVSKQLNQIEPAPCLELLHGTPSLRLSIELILQSSE